MIYADACNSLSPHDVFSPAPLRQIVQLLQHKMGLLDRYSHLRTGQFNMRRGQQQSDTDCRPGHRRRWLGGYILGGPHHSGLLGAPRTSAHVQRVYRQHVWHRIRRRPVARWRLHRQGDLALVLLYKLAYWRRHPARNCNLLPGSSSPAQSADVVPTLQRDRPHWHCHLHSRHYLPAASPAMGWDGVFLEQLAGYSLVRHLRTSHPPLPLYPVQAGRLGHGAAANIP